jgi:hypothetical protein
LVDDRLEDLLGGDGVGDRGGDEGETFGAIGR